MKYLALIFLFTSISYADEQPEYLKDGTIKVELKSGEEYKFDSNKWKVVDRNDARRVQELIDALRRELALCEEELEELRNQEEEEEVVVVVKDERKLNRIIGYVGAGPDGLAVKGGETKSVTPKQAALIGVGYSRVIYNDWSVSGVVSRGYVGNSKNYTGLLGVGKDF